MMDFKISLAQVLNLGFAKNGTGHWWLQRVTAVLLIPLSFFVIRLFDVCLTASYQQTVDWFASPINTIGIVAWLLAVFYHAALGLQVVIEDYVANPGIKTMSVWSVNMVFLLLGVAALVAVFRIVSVG
ncbi:Succinate dehydrogenase, hydrophobic membrane anchor protein [Crenothrix polyspora]|uniref:Succinate dehydrogenase hydrophobic membrane anchor subunit n=1 Tax=Crenothrix polyspora TaxID=360316 RepID=A0A1R4H7R0_9GAMM|nr:succinate dehydrogenase, hydrophobic membrane anchor protein [Crenothrix polyspora]SJM92239.1 Succinate dehydrogenase, hydrophobic membrane anchor protein [Crenothrix polyspora]